MLEWFRKSRKEPGWLSILLGPEHIQFVHGRFMPGGKSHVTRFGMGDAGAAPAAATDKLLRELRVERYQCTTLLGASEYQMLLVEAPNVPQAELKSAVRWKVKDMVDYPVANATIDLLDIPGEEGASSQRGRSLYAISARNEVIEGRMRAFEQSGIPLAVIDIPETAQRNIAALYEEEGRGLAFLHMEADSGLLTISSGGELCLARRMDTGFEALRKAEGEARESLFNRIVVELQRTFDHFERQFRFVAVGGLVLGPLPEETGLEAHLAANLAMSVRPADLADKLAFVGGKPDNATQWKLFHLIGASLRHEAKAH